MSDANIITNLEYAIDHEIIHPIHGSATTNTTLLFEVISYTECGNYRVKTKRTKVLWWKNYSWTKKGKPIWRSDKEVVNVFYFGLLEHSRADISKLFGDVVTTLSLNRVKQNWCCAFKVFIFNYIWTKASCSIHLYYRGEKFFNTVFSNYFFSGLRVLTLIFVQLVNKKLKGLLWDRKENLCARYKYNVFFRTLLQGLSNWHIYRQFCGHLAKRVWYDEKVNEK